jgi:hypothetical protein
MSPDDLKSAYEAIDNEGIVSTFHGLFTLRKNKGATFPQPLEFVGVPSGIRTPVFD